MNGLLTFLSTQEVPPSILTCFLVKVNFRIHGKQLVNDQGGHFLLKHIVHS